MRYRDLPTSPKPGVALWCPVCDQTYSACLRDYWMHDTCAVIEGCCGPRLRLIQKRVRYVRISAKRAEAS